MDALIFNKYLFTLRHLGFKATLKLSLKRLWSVNHYYVLKRNLSPLPAIDKIRSPVSIRKTSLHDTGEMIESLPFMDGESKKEMISRLLFYRSGFKNCYMAKTASNEIAYIQWLVFPSENSIIHRYLPDTFYKLNDDQVMIENAFAFPKFRGLGLMPHMTVKLLSMAKEDGYKSAIAYIRHDRVASLNELMKLGFKITKLIKEYKFLGASRRTLTSF